MPFPLATFPGQLTDTEQPSARAPHALGLWHLTSLDAPTVAVVWSLAFAWSAGVSLDLRIPLLQALGVWAIYIADRLLDAHRALRQDNAGQLRERHRFHWRHRYFFFPLGMIAACACAWMVFTFLPFAARERNSFLAAAAVVYMARVHSAHPKERLSARLRFPLATKEFFVGLLFTIGCALPAATHVVTRGSGLWLLLLPVFCFALLAWLNCYAIDNWEAPQPRRGKGAVFFFACLLALCCLLASLAYATHAHAAALLGAGAASALLLALLDRMRSRMTPLTLRAAADLVLLTPLVLLLR